MSEQKEQVLKNCPFCGYYRIIIDTNGFGSWFIKCLNCKVHTPCYEVAEQTIAAWNRRAAPAAEWIREPKEAGIYWKQDVFDTVKCDPVIQEVTLGGDEKLYAVSGIHRCEVKKICSQYRWWLKLSVPALPEEGGGNE